MSMFKLPKKTLIFAELLSSFPDLEARSVAISVMFPILPSAGPWDPTYSMSLLYYYGCRMNSS
ncbi:uncharacterized protein C8R40DRAFT_1088823 [Lentinula edodes]|uniref:uncharacterized protein n=1 Tax=Lentinula edodes TaxID=5353 RepID=UPI001E8DC48B|nr:uncharacterized protein C8R40DRAFT_1088823 [Lentinula edodes]KAH7879099.1 hypothetical protein C8R40DRAFT_1088823 [Lentinula edodes]